LFAAIALASCGGGREPSNANAAPTDDLNVTQVGPASVAAGATATFTAVVANGGKSEATNLTITETLTAGYTATVTCVPSFGATCPATLGQVMTLPSLTAGHWLTLTYQVAVPAGSHGNLVHQVQVSADAESDLTNNSASVTAAVVDARNGDYTVYAADGKVYDLVIDFDAMNYTMTVAGQPVQKTFVAGVGEYIVAGTQRLRVAADLIIGNHDFGAGLTPYIAARRLSTTLADTVFNLATRNVAADGTASTHAGSARITGNVLSICQTDDAVNPTQDCPVVLTSYTLTANGNTFTGVDTSGGPSITFQLARSGGSVIFLSSTIAADNTQQLRVGLQDSAGLAWGTLYGPTNTGDWVTMVLDAANIEYAVLGATTNDQAGLQKISNAGPFAMMVGKRLSDSADIYVMQTFPLAIVVGDFLGTANGTFQVAVP
jgi:uncharacterized repeat protein (TIGR01451 family)